MASLTVPRVCPGHSRPITEVDFSGVTEDGTFFVSGCLDKLPMLRNGDNGDWIGTFEGHKGAVWSAKINGDATRVVTGSADFTARVWDALTGEERFIVTDQHIVRTVAFSPVGGGVIAAGGQAKVLRLYDVAALLTEPLVSLAHAATIRKAVFTRDGRRVVTGGEDGVVRLWDVASAAEVASVTLSGPVMDLEMSAVSDTFAAAAGRSFGVYDVATLEAQWEHTVGFDVEAVSVDTAPGMRRCVVGGDLWIRVIDIESGAELGCHKGHHGPVHCLRFHPGGTAYISGSDDGTIRMWSVSGIGRSGAASSSSGGATA